MILLASCGHSNSVPLDTKIVVNEHYIVATPDPSLRTCEPRPSKPVLKSQSDVAVLITNLDERGEDCAGKLASTWKSIDQATADAAAKNSGGQ